MDRSIVIPLYRRVLRIVAAAQQDAALAKTAEARWAEFTPPGIRFRPNETLPSIARRSFELSSAKPETVGAGFAFLREASDSLRSIELLSLWDEVALTARPRGVTVQYDLIRGIALMSAALSLCEGGSAGGVAVPYRPHQMHMAATDYEQRLCHFMAPLRPCGAGAISGVDLLTPRGLSAYVHLVREHSCAQRRDAAPGDFTAVSLLREGRASECLLNVVLFLLLDSVPGLTCSLVGADMVFPWVRVDACTKSGKSSKPPVFLSWSYGALAKNEVERLVPTPGGPTWSRATLPQDSSHRRNVLLLLLRKQLSALSTPGAAAESAPPSAASVCKEQIIHLLSS